MILPTATACLWKKSTEGQNQSQGRSRDGTVLFLFGVFLIISVRKVQMNMNKELRAAHRMTPDQFADVEKTGE